MASGCVRHVTRTWDLRSQLSSPSECTQSHPEDTRTALPALSVDLSDSRRRALAPREAAVAARVAAHAGLSSAAGGGGGGRSVFRPVRARTRSAATADCSPATRAAADARLQDQARPRLCGSCATERERAQSLVCLSTLE